MAGFDLQIRYEGNVCKYIDGLDLHNGIMQCKIFNPVADTKKII